MIEARTQTLRAQQQLREMILSGALPAGERIVEVAVVEKLGMSRTPIRAALMRLAQEGLLQALNGGGFAVRTFSARDVSDAIDLRGTIEGLSARLAAERGVPSYELNQAKEFLTTIDNVLRSNVLNEAAFSFYVDANARFHASLSGMSGSTVIRVELERIAAIPFASPSAFVGVQANSPHARDMLVIAQDQHRQVLAAIEAREGMRAEALMREHSRIARRNLAEAMTHGHPTALPGVQLISQR